MRARGTPEGHVLRAVLDLCVAERILAFRMNSGAIRDASGRPVRFGVQGMADVLSFPRGRVLWVECKSETGRQSAAQREFQAQVEAHGQSYLLVRSPDDLLDWLNNGPRGQGAES